MKSKPLFSRQRKQYNHFHKNHKFTQSQVFEIVQKTKYNIPEFYSQKPDFDLLTKCGLDIHKSFYVEHAKNLDFSTLKSLYLAQKIHDFNCIIFYKNKKEIEAFKRFPIQANFLNHSQTQKHLKESIFALNINTDRPPKPVTFSKDFCGPKNAKITAKNISNFSLQTTYKIDNSTFIVSEKYLEGKFVFVNNLNKNTQKTIFLFKKTLFFYFLNYFSVKKIKNGYLFNNLTSGNKYYLLSNNNFIRLDFCKVKNSNNFQISAEINLQKKSKTVVYFGGQKVDVLFENIEEKINNILESYFNFQIKTNDKTIDFYLNKLLPDLTLKNMIENQLEFWQVRRVGLKSIKQILFFYRHKKLRPEEAYFSIKDLIFKQSENLLYFAKNDLGDYSISINHSNHKKNFEVVQNGQSKIVIDDVEYKNCCWLALDVLEKYNHFKLWL
ncbi:MAG: hypothetical protein IKT27_02040 [Clostridia bacterium]|nr:hypothetical protein [Clostridia bacterium]